LNWYQKEIIKDSIELNKVKNDFIKNIKKIDKEVIFDKKIKKQNLWQRIKKVLMGI
jgi:hypothetical protein